MSGLRSPALQRLRLQPSWSKVYQEQQEQQQPNNNNYQVHMMLINKTFDQKKVRPKPSKKKCAEIKLIDS